MPSPQTPPHLPLKRNTRSIPRLLPRFAHETRSGRRSSQEIAQFLVVVVSPGATSQEIAPLRHPGQVTDSSNLFLHFRASLCHSCRLEFHGFEGSHLCRQIWMWNNQISVLCSMILALSPVVADIGRFFRLVSLEY